MKTLGLNVEELVVASFQTSGPHGGPGTPRETDVENGGSDLLQSDPVLVTRGVAWLAGHLTDAIWGGSGSGGGGGW